MTKRQTHRRFGGGPMKIRCTTPKNDSWRGLRAQEAQMKAAPASHRVCTTPLVALVSVRPALILQLFVDDGFEGAKVARRLCNHNEFLYLNNWHAGMSGCRARWAFQADHRDCQRCTQQPASRMQRVTALPLRLA